MSRGSRTSTRRALEALYPERALARMTQGHADLISRGASAEVKASHAKRIAAVETVVLHRQEASRVAAWLAEFGR